MAEGIHILHRQLRCRKILVSIAGQGHRRFKNDIVCESTYFRRAAKIKLAIAWCKTNSFKKDWKKFLNNWFSNCLKRGGSITPYIPDEESAPITPYIPEESKEEKEARLEEVRKATRAIRERARLQEEERQKELRESAK